MSDLVYKKGQPLSVPIGDPVRVRLQVKGTAAIARLSGIHFDTDKTFVLPTAVALMRELASYSQKHPGRYHLIVGHTDTTGSKGYNLKLSVERGNTVAAFLTQAVDAWEQRFDKPQPAGQLWGIKEAQYMLSALPEPGDDKFFKGNPDGNDDVSYREAVKAFERSKGLPETGKADSRNKRTRRALSTDYLAIEGTSLAPATPVEILGCGESHPIEQPGQDDFASEVNRRVEVFLFDGDPVPPTSDCRKGQHPGCTAYDAWLAAVTHEIDANDDPSKVATLTLRLRDADEEPIAGTKYRLEVGEQKFEGTTDDDGTVTHEVPKTATSGALFIAEGRIDIVITAFAPVTTPAGARDRLANLGFLASAAPGPGAGDAAGGDDADRLALALKQFQGVQGLDTTGTLDGPTSQKLEEEHGC